MASLYYACLSKKVAMPNGAHVHALSWNPEHGWLAAGCDAGLVKVLKFEQATADSSARGVAAAANLGMNQTLDGHKESAAILAAWNAPHRKLATADASGLIIVWTLHKGAWVEEMINNRNKSVVRDLRWRGNGAEICIAYEDGMVIVGTVEGARLWSKDVGARLALLEWAPNGQALLFATAGGPVVVHNNQGVRVGALPLVAVADLLPPGADLTAAALPPALRVVALEWYDGAEGYAAPDARSLAVAFANGRVQLMRGLDDEAPVCLDTALTPLVGAKWNSNGSVFAVAGQKTAPSGASVSEVQFYLPDGRFLNALKVPGGTVGALTWEGGGLRVAVRPARAAATSNVSDAN